MWYTRKRTNNVASHYLVNQQSIKFEQGGFSQLKNLFNS